MWRELVIVRRVAFLLRACARHFVLVWLVLSATHPAIAVQPDEILKDPALETRARALSRELRCMVCQNESIDDSDAPLAHDVRVLVRERLTAGDSDSEVIDFLVARYGEFVLLTPRLPLGNAILWGGPLAVVASGLIVLVLRRRTHERSEPEPLTDQEEDALEKLNLRERV